MGRKQIYKTKKELNDANFAELAKFLAPREYHYFCKAYQTNNRGRKASYYDPKNWE